MYSFKVNHLLYVFFISPLRSQVILYFKSFFGNNILIFIALKRLDKNIPSVLYIKKVIVTLLLVCFKCPFPTKVLFVVNLLNLLCKGLIFIFKNSLLSLELK